VGERYVVPQKREPLADVESVGSVEIGDERARQVCNTEVINVEGDY
jgi:hypothetical protein